MIFLLAGLLAGVVVTFYFVYVTQARVYEQLISMLASDRDSARHEAQVYRGILAPSLRRAEAGVTDAAAPVRPAHPGPGQAKTTPAPAVSNSSASRLRFGGRTPFRRAFNFARQATNTPQNRVNALADAIQTARNLAANKSVEEKTNVSETR